MLAANIILPAINGYFYAATRNSTSTFEYTGYVVFVVADCALLLVSGCMLISAALQIRKSLNQRDSYFNVRQLVLHATAFALYMTAFIGLRVMLIVTGSVRDTCLVLQT